MNLSSFSAIGLALVITLSVARADEAIVLQLREIAEEATTETGPFFRDRAARVRERAEARLRDLREIGGTGYVRAVEEIFDELMRVPPSIYPNRLTFIAECLVEGDPDGVAAALRRVLYAETALSEEESAFLRRLPFSRDPRAEWIVEGLEALHSPSIARELSRRMGAMRPFERAFRAAWVNGPLYSRHSSALARIYGISIAEIQAAITLVGAPDRFGLSTSSEGLRSLGLVPSDVKLLPVRVRNALVPKLRPFFTGEAAVDFGMLALAWKKEAVAEIERALANGDAPGVEAGYRALASFEPDSLPRLGTHLSGAAPEIRSAILRGLVPHPIVDPSAWTAILAERLEGKETRVAALALLLRHHRTLPEPLSAGERRRVLGVLGSAFDGTESRLASAQEQKSMQLIQLVEKFSPPEEFPANLEAIARAVLREDAPLLRSTVLGNIAHRMRSEMRKNPEVSRRFVAFLAEADVESRLLRYFHDQRDSVPWDGRDARAIAALYEKALANCVSQGCLPHLFVAYRKQLTARAPRSEVVRIFRRIVELGSQRSPGKGENPLRGELAEIAAEAERLARTKLCPSLFKHLEDPASSS